MKKSFALIALIVFILACVILNVVLFLTIPTMAPEGRASEDAFKLVWTFTFPLNLIIWIFGLGYLSRKSTDLIVHYPIMLFVLGGGFAAYVYVGFKSLFYSPNLTMTFAAIVEIAMTAAYIAIILVALFVLRYMGNNQKTTKEKVLFIRLLKADVDACIPLVNSPELKSLLGKLSEKVRFSDPMSHDSLKACEDEISALVVNLQMKARTGEENGLEEDIKKIDMLIDYRNERCKILK